MTTWYLAVCTGCKLPPQPFTAEAVRDTWADDHARLTGHAVDLVTDPGDAAPPAGWSLLGETDGGWPIYAAPAGTPMPESRWPDGQPVTPWADPWHDAAADLRAVPPPRPPADDQCGPPGG